MNRSTSAFVVVLLFLARLSADPQSQLTGQVTDSEGAVIANGRVVLHWDSSGGLVGYLGLKQDVTVVTNASGFYSADCPAGFYDVFVSAPAFTPIAAKVIIKEQNAMFNPKLHVDPLVSKEIGGMKVEGIR